jgi:putative hydrolase of the HAD superfamily
MVRSDWGQREDIPYIFFDLGNTLLYYQGDRVAIELEAYHALLNSLVGNGIKLPAKTFLKRFQKAMQQYYHRRETTLIEETTMCQLKTVLNGLGYENPPDLVMRKALDQMYRVTEEYWQLDPETMPCLSWLYNAGFRLGLISNASDSTNVFRLLRKHKIYGFFSGIFISAVIGYRKPHSQIFTTALHSCPDAREEHVFMVGDLISTDIVGGKKNGMQTIWLSKHARYHEEPEINAEIQPDLMLPSLNALRAWMEEKYPS